jgi:hypothetical protein
MGKLTGIVNGLKFALKYAVVILAVVKIIEFAIKTFEDIAPKEEKTEQENG